MTPRAALAGALRALVLPLTQLLEVSAAALEDERPETAGANASEWVALGETGLPRKTLLGAVRTGKLCAYRVGRELFFERGELKGWMRTQAVEPSRLTTSPSVRDEAAAALERARKAGVLRIVESR